MWLGYFGKKKKWSSLQYPVSFLSRIDLILQVIWTFL